LTGQAGSDRLSRVSLLERVEAAIGARLLRTVVAAQRRSLGAVVRKHRDRRGRITKYLDLGTARRGTLVWLHGFGDRIDTFLPTARRLAGDYRILVPAMPGFPDGWIDDTERHTFAAYAGWVGEVVRDVASERFHLMGNSLGGATALAIAAAMPERLESVVAVNSAGVELAGVRSIADEMRDGHNLFAVSTREDYDRLTSRIFAAPPRIPRPVRAHLFREQRAKADWYRRLLGELAESTLLPHVSAHVDLEAIRVPTLVVWGDRDTLFPLILGEHVARTVANAKLHVLDRVGHCPHLESPGRLASAFRSFADRP
jgi:pimeloyl-ACP methyl ester carboxylesterase